MLAWCLLTPASQHSSSHLELYLSNNICWSPKAHLYLMDLLGCSTTGECGQLPSQQELNCLRYVFSTFFQNLTALRKLAALKAKIHTVFPNYKPLVFPSLWIIPAYIKVRLFSEFFFTRQGALPHKVQTRGSQVLWCKEETASIIHLCASRGYV